MIVQTSRHSPAHLTPAKTLKDSTNTLLSVGSNKKISSPRNYSSNYKVPYHEIIKSLNDLDREEIKYYNEIYYWGQNKKNMKSGYTGSNGEYCCQLHDHILFRYEILQVLGNGCFGQVFKILDHKTQIQQALKIIKNQPKLQKQALIEVNILNYIKEHDSNQLSNIARIETSFSFRKHQCIIFEMLDLNLYEYLKLHTYEGLNADLVRKIAIQILNSLHFLRKNNIMHCDIKPENILLQDRNRTGIKLVDFGSSCFDGLTVYSYIQSRQVQNFFYPQRYYRAPEVIFGLNYGPEIDIWSCACVLAELLIGRPLFPGQNEQEQIHLISEVLGTPSKECIKNLPRRKLFFDDKGELLQNEKSKSRQRSLGSILSTKDEMLINFLLQCFRWDPKERIKPIDALNHPWIVQVVNELVSIQALPKGLRMAHEKYIEKEKTEKTGGKTLEKQKSLNVIIDVEEKIEQKKAGQMSMERDKKENKSFSQENKQIIKNQSSHYSLCGFLSARNADLKKKGSKFQF